MAKTLEQTNNGRLASTKLGRLAFAMRFPEVACNESSFLVSPGEREVDCTFYQFLRKREALYKILGRIFKVEVDPQFIKELQDFAFPVRSKNAGLAKGAMQMDSLVKAGSLNIDELASDYAQVFLGEGALENGYAVPYESAYTSPEGRILHDAFEQVLRIFYAQGFSSDVANIYFDHVGLELEFMASLSRKSQKAIQQNNPSSLSKTLSDQKKFLDAHLLNWAPSFLSDVQKCSKTPFYQSAALMTSGLLQLENEQFAGC